IKVGDNDTLAALVAGMARADLTILLTTIDGMRERDEATGALGRRMSVVHELGSEVYSMAQGTDGNRFSVGGMITKLRAAAMVTRSGEPLIIADGYDFAILPRIMAAADVGTVFLPSRQQRMHARQRFLAFFSEPKGELIVDEGAAKAICGQGRSLLSGGVVGLRGTFKVGDTVRIVNLARQEIGRGTVNFSHEDVSRICGAKSGDLERLLNRPVTIHEVVHRDAMVLM
ncbi:MAG: glutamate 5-kinase, partial [Lentisphaeria bacterium]|nr:glutamate 5-kinase [Lentisphaeria bacterium]